MARNQSKMMMSRRRNKNSLLMNVIVIATMKVAVASTAARSVVGKLLMSNSIFFILMRFVVLVLTSICNHTSACVTNTSNLLSIDSIYHPSDSKPPSKATKHRHNLIQPEKNGIRCPWENCHRGR